MISPSKRLGITRSTVELESEREYFSGCSIEIVPVPVTQIKPIDFSIPLEIQLSEIDWLLFTSANAVNCFFDGLKKLDLSVPKSIKSAVMGEKTAQALSAYDLKTDFLPSTQNGKTLFTEFIEKYRSDSITVLYLSAKEITLDPAEMFAQSKMKYMNLVVYETVNGDCLDEIHQTLSESDYILFTAPSAVRAYARLFAEPRAGLLAIGPTTQLAMIESGWREPQVLAKPEIQLAVEYMRPLTESACK